MVIREISKQKAHDLVIGAKILSCGGGGSEKKAIENINQVYDKGDNFTIADLSDFNDEDHICIIGMVGGGITKEERELVQSLSITQKNPMREAVKQLEDFLEVRFSAFVATELGPNNSIIPLMVAAQMGKIGIDGDCCGRSKPKISISTTRVAGIPIAPFSIVNQFGDIQIVKKTVNDIRGEIIAREASKISGGVVSVARCPMTIKQAKNAVISSTFSLAMQLGQRIREVNEKGGNPLEAIKNVLPDSNLVFSGKVKEFSRIERSGFTSGNIILESVEKTKNLLKIWYQNEYLLSWLNGEYYITCPDGFYIIDPQTGYGLTPWEEDFFEEREVVVFTKDAPKIWQSKKGLDVFGPQVFNRKWSAYRKASSFD